ncbi:hypothetical protein ACIA8G_41900 [Lentzea sp. NPDC051213]|uniref:hypothetical protein n=1 Tax=Lentzea sp. NPDC051213 TaxID=3364126 RepID=UPI00379CC81C
MANGPITPEGRRRLREALLELPGHDAGAEPATKSEVDILSEVMVMLAFHGMNVARRVRSGAAHGLSGNPRAAQLLDEYEELVTRAGSLSQQFLGLAKHFDEPANS